jgi:hypothetical protein
VVSAAGLLGAIVAGLVVLGMLYFDDSIRSADDVQRYLELPVLAVVPRLQRRARAAIGTHTAQAAQPPTEKVEVPKTAARV